jgi:hypothetical protein
MQHVTLGALEKAWHFVSEVVQSLASVTYEIRNLELQIDLQIL